MALILKPTEYSIEHTNEEKNKTQDYAKYYKYVTIVRRGKNSWVIKDGPMLLNKDGDWVYEPMPSSRADEFRISTQFDSPTNALTFYQQYVKHGVTF